MNTLVALILVYTAKGLPLAILILGEFIQQIPSDLATRRAATASASTASSSASSCR